MSNSGGSQQTSSGPPEWLQQIGQQFLGRGANTVFGQPYEQYQGPQVAPFTGLQNQAFGMGANAGYNPNIQSANSALGGILSGQNQNPFLSGVIDDTTNRATEQFNQASNNLAGRFSGNAANSTGYRQTQGSLNEDFGRGLGSAIGGLNYQNYNDGQNRLMQAIPMAYNTQGMGINNAMGLYNLGATQQGYGQRLMDTQYNDWQRSQDFPWQQMQRFGSLLGLGGGTAGQTQRSYTTGDPYSQILGGSMLLGKGIGKSGNNSVSSIPPGGS